MSIGGPHEVLPHGCPGRAIGSAGRVPQGGVTVNHPDHLLAGSLQQHLLA